ncbi:hypothetical protein I7I48_04326 [Histoplasma ohiense]|nr:hypothetical protein I7I48_04326 [Histoplasma ohiense (nom. inval.)]
MEKSPATAASKFRASIDEFTVMFAVFWSGSLRSSSSSLFTIFIGHRVGKGSRPALHRQKIFEAVLYALLDITCVSCVSFPFLL